MSNLWENDEPVSDLGIDVPVWIEQGITPYDVAAVIQGGCNSGAYMPAVTYHQAMEVMSANGDEVMDFTKNALGSLEWPECDTSWPGLACHFLSIAVELWCCGVEDEISDALDEIEEGDES